MNSVFRGIWAGLIATSTMTTAMFKIHRELPSSQKSPLPPALLTENILRKSPLAESAFHRKSSKSRSESQMQATMTAHFAFGAVTGILYALISPEIKAAPALKGSLYGLGVWGASYLGWIPAFGLRPQAPRMTFERNIMMILAHLVWGATLGYNENELRRRGILLLDGRKNKLLAE